MGLHLAGWVIWKHNPMRMKVLTKNLLQGLRARRSSIDEYMLVDARPETSKA